MIRTLQEKCRSNLFLLTQCRSFETWAAMKGHRRPETTSVLLRCARAPILCRGGTSDISVVWEVFGNREYECPGGWPFRSVLDLGANCGIFAAYAWAQTEGQLTHYLGVEPDYDAFEALRVQIEQQGMTGISRLFRCAAWNRNGTVHFDDSGQSYVHHISTSGRLEVPARTIDSLLDEAGLETVDLIKIDVEGAEAQLLTDMSPWAHRAGAVVVELHNGLSFDWFARCVQAAGFEALRPGDFFRGHPAALPRHRTPASTRLTNIASL
jgi:FkbM family methyltransferase